MSAKTELAWRNPPEEDKGGGGGGSNNSKGHIKRHEKTPQQREQRLARKIHVRTRTLKISDSSAWDNINLIIRSSTLGTFIVVI